MLGLLLAVLVLLAAALVATSRRLHLRDTLWRARESSYQSQLDTLRVETSVLRTELERARAGRAPMPVPVAHDLPVLATSDRAEGAPPLRRRASATIRQS